MNFGNLIKAFDAVMAFRDATRRLKGGSEDRPAETALATGTAANTFAGQIEARLTNVVVAALKEAFDRDHARLELERAQLEDQRRRAEEALRLELRRQAADREVGRLRLLAAAALVGWLASVLVLGTRAGDAALAARVALGAGWLLLLASLAAAFSAQSRASAAVIDATVPLDHGPAASAALWFLVSGLAVTALSLLIG
jgi:hypothetical protein